MPPHALSLNALPLSTLPLGALPLTALLPSLLPHFAPHFAQALPHSPAAPAPVISLIGGGGKTTLLFALARTLAASGFTVITSTTTHIFPPTPAESPLTLSCPALPTAPALRQALQQYGHITVTGQPVVTKQQQAKLSGLSFEDIARLRRVAHLLLVEADGAAMRPLKAPASHEPAVPPCTDVCIALCGMQGLGKPLLDSVHRPEKAAALCHCLPTDTVTPAHLAHLALHPQGLFRTTPPDAPRAVLCTLPPHMPADTGRALAAQARHAAHELYPRHPAAWWVGSALDGWVMQL